MSSTAPTRNDFDRIAAMAALAVILFTLHGAATYAIQHGAQQMHAYGAAAAVLVTLWIIPTKYSLPLALAGLAWVLHYRYGVEVPR